ncbi:hypothetical protein ACHBTE_09525 [Streptomyces sp. M41]|uniref:hypothetical protein n=1 Tax=Streptomyces sp. M41 TaxID=3059412 RepID=UPI00374DF0E4
MTSPIDDLLARARLHRRPYPQAAIDAAVVRLSLRAASLSGAPRPNPTRAPRLQAPPVLPGRIPALPPHDERSAADDLQTLCETVITHADALTDLEEFLSRALPSPPGARVLGCMLQLCSREESARFWWQYAAGAGDAAASYCLYLHHRSLGEHGVADWWQTQHARYTRSVRPADGHPSNPGPGGEGTVLVGTTIRVCDPASGTEDEISTTLRVLRALKPDSSPVPEPVNAVLHYVPAAVAYVDDDLDLPLPDPDFTDRIRALVAPAAPVAPPTATPERPRRRGRQASPALPPPAPLPSRPRTRDPAPAPDTTDPDAA